MPHRKTTQETPTRHRSVSGWGQQPSAHGHHIFETVLFCERGDLRERIDGLDESMEGHSRDLASTLERMADVVPLTQVRLGQRTGQLEGPRERLVPGLPDPLDRDVEPLDRIAPCASSEVHEAQ